MCIPQNFQSKPYAVCYWKLVSSDLWWGLVVQTPVHSAAHCSCSTHKAGCPEGCSPQRRCIDTGWGKGCWQAPHEHGWYCRHTSPGRPLLHCHHPGRLIVRRRARHTPWRHWTPSSCRSWSPRCLQNVGCKGLPTDREEILRQAVMQKWSCCGAHLYLWFILSVIEVNNVLS